MIFLFFIVLPPKLLSFRNKFIGNRKNPFSNTQTNGKASIIQRNIILLKLYTGMTFNKFLQKTRCELAGKMLQDTDKTIPVICEEVGYNDLKHFFSLFKKYMGTTPYNYRKKHLTSLQNSKFS